MEVAATIRRATMTLAAACAALLLVGCGAYELRGRAIEGSTSAVYIVDRDDPRLDDPGLSGAVVSLTLDPDRLSAKHAGNDMADVDGDFAVRVEEFGAGVLEYPARLDARLEGYRGASARFELPSRRKRVLVVLAPGEDDPPAGSENFLDETLRMGEPYMN